MAFVTSCPHLRLNFELHGRGVVKWLAELVHDHVVLGSIPIPFILFQESLYFFSVSALRNRMNKKVKLAMLL